jgi:undecaprenyl-diphosphatase
MNQSLFNTIFGLSHRIPFMDALGILTAVQLPYVLGLAGLIFIFLERDSRKRILLACEMGMALILSRGIIVEAIRFFYIHPRPNVEALITETTSSFPSGHAAFFFALAMVLWYANKKWGAWFFALALVNGLARIYVGVHWPFDIAGGALAGIASAMITHSLLARYWEEVTPKESGEIGIA